MTHTVTSRILSTGTGVAALMAIAACAHAGPRPTPATEAVVAFPGAAGAGRISMGGRGGAVVRVTNLNDSGPGSLRAAVETEGPRTVVFDIGGTIHLLTPLRIREPRITLAGQTAPGGGITLRGQPLLISADDVVVRYIRSRLGDADRVETDAVTIDRGSRIILDHVSASWSVDETLSIGSRDRVIDAVTVQWSIIAESLNLSTHSKGDHGYGSLVRGNRGAHFTFHHNLWASHRARMPRPGNYLTPDVDPVGPRFEFTNNIFYNWGQGHAGYNSDTDPATVSTYVFVANAYRRGPDSTGAIIFEEESTAAHAWFDANSVDGVVPGDPWDPVTGDDTPGYRLTALPDWATPATETAEQAWTSVLARAGASRVRDAVDVRVVAGVTEGTGRIINSQTDVGGWPDLAPGTPWTDTDGDGMPDDWEAAHGHDPRVADGAADSDGDGYTNLEDWLNSLAG
ncbi:pectate lyase [Brevundimonas sp. AJA228-03]|uniref:pectate lyase n=1 Tax=Brevundimonas sp. AJA228-03 TaxID=2752515 RepID=UPI001ADF68BE|nr:pectate lyase [Brevundimonas sp. AJA228-03]QTN18229.1 pectate lyase [Brevundimonas sp. AJA228-03]